MMIYKTWEKKLRKELRSIPKDERERVVEYYREMHDELAAHGKTEEKILLELGSPQKCAQTALSDGNSSSESAEKSTSSRKKRSFTEIVGLFIATILFILPLFCVLASVVISFAAVCLSGAAVGLAGVFFAIGYPIYIGAGVAAWAGVGTGLAASGVGLLLFVAFFYATKYSSIATIKFLQAIYKRR